MPNFRLILIAMKDTPPLSTRRIHSIKICSIVGVLIVVALIGLIAIPYPHIRQIADRLAPDGSFESFTTQIHRLFQIGLLLLSLLLLSASVFALLKPFRASEVTQKTVKGVIAFFRNWLRDAALAFRELPERILRKDMLIPIMVLIVFAFLARILYINDPMRHDEAYSFVVFAKLPLRLAIADYHFPNNHLFHTLLLHLSQQLFGNNPWAVRLPAVCAGIALIPAGYLLARGLFGKTTAWVAGAALASAPILIHYSTNARGYSLLALCTVLVFIIAVELTRRSNLFYWSLAALISALGFYTLPVFLIPFAIIITWLAFSGLNRQTIPSGARANWFVRLTFFTSLTLIFTGLLYLPVFRYSGVESVFANPYVESLSWKEFWPTFGSRLEDIASEWTQKVPLIAAYLTILGFGLSLILHRQISRRPVSTQLAAFVAIPVILVIQRPNPWAKIWQFLFPLLLIWSAAGLVAALQWIQKRIATNIPLAAIGAGMMIAGLAAMAAVNAVRDHPGLRNEPGPVEQAAIYFDARLTKDDIVVIAPIDDAPLWYYFYKYDLPQETFRRDVPFKKAYVLVSRDQGQTLDDVLSVRGPDRIFLNMSTLAPVAAWGSLELYSIDANWEAVSKAYQLHNP